MSHATDGKIFSKVAKSWWFKVCMNAYFQDLNKPWWYFIITVGPQGLILSNYSNM